ncbi:MAG: LacI family DNA-binding transcriptional regulator [Pelomonas sp.]|nr:LacI family DNA-binding transcriptional regulator [Roseateles sp.]
MADKPKKTATPDAAAPKPARARRTPHAATLADVGREAGVSVMAASAVINGSKTSSRISAETRVRIVEAARKLNYRPNAAARALADRRMNTIGVVTTLARNELNQYFLEVFNGVMESAAEAGQNTTVFALGDWAEGATRVPQFCDGRIDGLILLAPLLESVQLPEHTPFVSVHANNQLPGVPNLESDEETGAHALVAQMLALGHRRILHLAGPADSIGAQRRVAGWRRAHREAGVEPPKDYLAHGNYTFDWGRSGLEAWLAAHAGKPLPDAIFGGSDAIALGCMDTLLARGLRVPADISVAGFDDTAIARSAHLSTVRQPLREMGHRAVQLLVGQIEAKLKGTAWRAPGNTVFPTEVVSGQTLAEARTTQIVLP